jgi:hypothetical protein
MVVGTGQGNRDKRIAAVGLGSKIGHIPAKASRTASEGRLFAPPPSLGAAPASAMPQRNSCAACWVLGETEGVKLIVVGFHYL